MHLRHPKIIQQKIPETPPKGQKMVKKSKIIRFVVNLLVGAAGSREERT